MAHAFSVSTVKKWTLKKSIHLSTRICVEQMFVWNFCAIASLYFSHARVTQQDTEEIRAYAALPEATQVIRGTEIWQCRGPLSRVSPHQQ